MSPPGGLLYRRALPAIGENVPWIRRELLAALERAEIAADRLPDIALVVSEAVTNVVMHAYRDRAPGLVFANARRVGTTLVVSVSDLGCGMSPRTDSPGIGMGLGLIRTLADEVEVSTGVRPGTCVRVGFAGAVPHFAAPSDGPRRRVALAGVAPVRTSSASLREMTYATIERSDRLIARSRAALANAAALVGDA